MSSEDTFLNEEMNRSSQTSWINLPRLSLIELAYKLKQTEQKLFKEEWNSFESGSKEEEEQDSDQDNGVEETENNEFYFGIEQTAKDALQAIKQSYVDLEESSSNVLEDQLNPFQTSMTPKVKKRFGCGWCNYTTDSRSHLIRHSKALHKDKDLNVVLDPDSRSEGRPGGDLKKRHQCDMCQYKTDCRSHLKRHQASVHCKDKSYQCPLCNEEFARPEKAKEHHFRHHPEKHFDIRNMHKIKQHGMLDANEDSDANRGKSVFSETDLINMYLKHTDESNTDNKHPSMNLAPEDLSNTTFSFIKSKNATSVEEVASSEGDTNHSPFACSKAGGLIRCLKCNKMCKDLWQLRGHVAEAHPCSREHFCKVCPYSTNQQQRLLTHMLKHEEIFCGLCDFSTINNSFFHLHTQTCNSKRVFTCSICNITFNDFQAYKQHMATLHTDHCTKQCPNCVFTCQSSKELNQHIKLHEWRSCQVCSYLAPNHEGLILHISESHAVYEDGQWVCRVCQHSEASSEQLANHFDTHVPGYFHCNVTDCSFKSHLESSLELHSKYMHSSDSDSLIPDTDVSKTVGNTSKQAYTRKSDHTFYTSHKRFKPATDITSSLKKKKSLDGHQSFRPSIIPTFLFSEDDTIVVTPTSPCHKKEEPMFCPRCPERAPFVYKRSFQKHINQHAMEDQMKKC